MIISDYNTKTIDPQEFCDLKEICNIRLADLSLEDTPNLLVFPDSINNYDSNLGHKMIGTVSEGLLHTNSVVGFVGRNGTQLSIHSRFTIDNEEDYFLHYMLQRVAQVNVFNLQHSTNDEEVFNFLVYLFPQHLKRAISQGLFKQYVANQFNDANVRGVIDVNRQIRINTPFYGRVAYTTREHCYDNALTQLIRHTIEFLSKEELGKSILSSDTETQETVEMIRWATPSFSQHKKLAVINHNLRSVVHPYYNEYTPLQRLCLQILRHEEMKYGWEQDEVYGVLIDAAWLWEEYLALLIDPHFKHYLRERGPRFHLFENGKQQLIPDYLKKDRSVVADAKYIPLDKESNYGEEKATAIYYKTITYMYRFCTNKALLLYPHPDEIVKPITYQINTEKDGINGGQIIKLGLRIPGRCSSFSDFCNKMRNSEKEFLEILMHH